MWDAPSLRRFDSPYVRAWAAFAANQLKRQGVRAQMAAREDREVIHRQSRRSCSAELPGHRLVLTIFLPRRRFRPCEAHPDRFLFLAQNPSPGVENGPSYAIPRFRRGRIAVSKRDGHRKYKSFQEFTSATKARGDLRYT